MKLISTILLSTLTGCAIQTTPRGYPDFKIDGAELFGRDVGSFKLEDGSEGRLRVLNGEHSIKLQNRMRVVPIPNATSAAIFASQSIDGRVVLIVEASEKKCSHKTHLFSIKESEVLSWSIGDCRQQPKISISSNEAVFDFTYGNQTTRFTYTDSRVIKSDLSTAAAAAYRTATTTQPERSRYSPSPPKVIQKGQKPSSTPDTIAPITSSSKLTKSTNPAPTTPAPTRNLIFSNQEQRPVRIVLDR